MTDPNHNHAAVYDVIIVGASIAGIDAAYYVQSKLPAFKYTILEGRTDIGGTWDLFRYPGLRTDSDIFTWSFPWNPWMEKRNVVDGESVKNYLRASAAKEGIDKHIQLQHHVTSANWISPDQCWELTVQTPGGTDAFRARFLFLGTGYYDYEEALPVDIPGLDKNFKGKVIHPQFWPENLDYTGKDVVVIGSGATAVTLLPSLAKKAGHVTMLQRSPAYIVSIPNRISNSLIHRILPRAWSFKLSRLMVMWVATIVFYLARAFPDKARAALQGKVAEQLPKHIPVDPHFQPTYRPWDQRVCIAPEGDFFDALRSGKAGVATGKIETMTEDTIVLESGQRIKADIIVTATGLKLVMGGRIQLSLDGEPIDIADRFAWKVTLLQDIPNLAVTIGYINTSWTLGTETSSQLVSRILRHMQRNGYTSVVPRMPAGARVQTRPYWDLNATHVRLAEGRFPKAGDIGPWRGRSNYILDLWRAKYGSITDALEYSRGTIVDKFWK